MLFCCWAEKTLHRILHLAVHREVHALFVAAFDLIAKQKARRASIVDGDAFRHIEHIVPLQFNSTQTDAITVCKAEKVRQNAAFGVDPFALQTAVNALSSCLHQFLRLFGGAIAFEPIKPFRQRPFFERRPLFRP